MGVELKRGPTRAQRAWIKQLCVLTGTPIADDAADMEDAVLSPGGEQSSAAGARAPGQSAGNVSSAGDQKDLVGGLLPDPVDVLKDLAGPLSCTCTIENNTGQVLQLAKQNLDSGEFKKPPPTQIPSQKGLEFIAVNKSFLGLHAAGVDGTVSYSVGNQKTIWTLHFVNPRVGKNHCDVTLDGPTKGQFEAPTPVNGDGNDAFYSFILNPKGGPSPKPDPGPSTDVAVSCRVAVVNQTQQTIFLRKQDKDQGDYVTNPANSLAPGASTQFVFAETPNSKDHGCRGKMSWDIGDPKLGTWGLMWDNPKGSKNLTAGFLNPDNGTFHSLEQIDEGDENVPVTFTLSGGGGAGPSAKPTSCAIMVKNATSAVLTLRGSQADSGAFQTKPPATIAAGDTALITFAGLPDNPGKGAKGSMLWDVGDPKVAAWTTSWDNPPGDKNTVDGKLDPATAGFKSDATTADGDDDVAMSFTVSGGASPTPDDEFAPPPKSKQPTLRKGDESPDGWVEYAQRLLNKNKLDVTVNGMFDGAMEAKVKKFQGDNNCQIDGVIGNETWSVLREGPHEAVGTDARKPHTFEQKNAQARFVTERPDSTGYDVSDDSYFMRIVSTGEQPIDKFHATLKVTQPDQTSHTHKVEIGAAKFPSPDGQGNFHVVEVKPFKRVFGLKKGVDPLTCSVDAYLDDDIGGDRWTGPVTPTS